jgi:lipoprotein-anchoring transpeptidase ErfK/SrfK
MVDYYSILLRAVTAPGAGEAQWRRGVYDRAQQMLASQLRSRQPPLPQDEIADEIDAMDIAIERIESEMAWTERGAGARATQDYARDGDIAGLAQTGSMRGPMAGLPRLNGAAWIALAVILAALGAGGYVFWGATAHKSAPAPVKNEAAATVPPPEPRATAKDGELAAGIDGGSSDRDLPYVFRRQPTFYRTLEPTGTIIVDKLQRYLYFILPNNVAVRYGIALGEQCDGLVGLRHVASMAEWPAWQATPDMIKRKLASPGTVPGGPGNPLGARVLNLDDGSSRIHGTNAPKTIGSAVEFGCIRLVNDDIVDLYNRVVVNTPVVVN